MADTIKIAGYEAMVMQIGFVFTEQVSTEVWDEAANYEVDSSRWINVEEVLVTLEEKQENGELTEAEQKLWDLCEAAEQQGLQDIVINPP